MAAKQNILYHLLIAMVALNISFAFSSEINSAEHQIKQGEHRNDNEVAEKRFRWPSSVGVTIHRTGEVNLEVGAPTEQQIGQSGPPNNHHHHHHHNHSAHDNDTEDGERRFHLPGFLGAFFRAGEVNLGPGAIIEQQIGQKVSQNNHHHHHHHNHSAHGNDTESSQRKFHWPSSVEFSIHRAGEVNSEAGAPTEHQMGQSGPQNNHQQHHHHNHSAHGNDTESSQRKFHWPSSVEFSIHRAAEVNSEAGAPTEHQMGQSGPQNNHQQHHHHNHSAHGNDTESSQRKFHWPSSVEFSIHRAGEVNSEAGAPTEHQIGQSGTQNNHQQHHHHNHSAHGNDTESSQRKFHWPSSVEFSIHRAADVNSEARAPTEYQIGQSGPQNNHHHNHSAHFNDTEDGERRFHLPGFLGAFFRAGEVNLGPGAIIEQQIEQNVSQNNHHHHHHHNHSADGNDTESSQRKFHWPSSVEFSIHRAAEVNSEAGAPTEHQMGQSGPQNNHQQHHHHNHSAHGNDTESSQRKFHWPSSVEFSIHRAGEINLEAGAPTEHQIGQSGPQNNHHHNHRAHGNDTEDGERKFHLPGFLGAFFRAGEVNSGAGAIIEQQIGQNESQNNHHHHHNHSENGNDMEDGQRRFHLPSSVEISIHRAGELSQEGAGASIQPGHMQQDREERLYGVVPVLVSCNHTKQAGRTCADCTHSLMCFSNNIGVRRDCGPLYCNKGMCSSEPSVSCNATLGS